MIIIIIVLVARSNLGGTTGASSRPLIDQTRWAVSTNRQLKVGASLLLTPVVVRLQCKLSNYYLSYITTSDLIPTHTHIHTHIHIHLPKKIWSLGQIVVPFHRLNCNRYGMVHFNNFVKSQSSGNVLLLNRTTSTGATSYYNMWYIYSTVWIVCRRS